MVDLVLIKTKVYSPDCHYGLAADNATAVVAAPCMQKLIDQLIVK